MDHIPPSKVPQAEIRMSDATEQIRKTKPPEFKNESIPTEKILDMLISKIGDIQVSDTNMGTRLVRILAAGGIVEANPKTITKSEGLKLLMEKRQNLYGKVVPNFKVEAPAITNLDAAALNFKVQSNGISNAITINPDINPGSGTVENGVFRTVSHVTRKMPDEIISSLSTESKSVVNTDYGEVTSTKRNNDPRFSNNQGNIEIKGVNSNNADFSVGGNIEAIRNQIAMKLSDPNLLTDAEVIARISQGEITRSTMFNGRSATTGEALIVPEVLINRPLPIFSDSLNLDGANLSIDQVNFFKQKGSIIAISNSTIRGSSGSGISIQLNDGHIVNGNHMGNPQLTTDQARVIEKNNPPIRTSSKS